MGALAIFDEVLIGVQDDQMFGPLVVSGLGGLATEVHRPGCEEHLSMTLGRLFDAEARNLLLAVAMGPDNHPAAFCQFVPAPAIGGYTLDQVRRTLAAVTDLRRGSEGLPARYRSPMAIRFETRDKREGVLNP